MINKIFRPLKEGFHGVFRHGAMSFSASVAVTITLMIVSLFLIFSLNVRKFTQGLEQSVQIAVMVDYDHESAEQEDAISLAIQNIPDVSSVKFSSKADELQYYFDSFQDEDARKLFAPFAQEDNPFHDAYYVEVSDGTKLEAVAGQIAQIPGVYNVSFGGTSATRLISVLRVIRYGGGILAFALSILAVALISNTIKLTILARADEIAIMRNVGARNSFIRSPFLVEGILIGAFGALLPMIATYYGYRYLYTLTGGYIVSRMFTLLPLHPFVLDVNAALLLVGMVVGLLGAFFSVTRYLRWKR